jgi:hypothetical protein
MGFLSSGTASAGVPRLVDVENAPASTAERAVGTGCYGNDPKHIRQPVVRPEGAQRAHVPRQKTEREIGLERSRDADDGTHHARLGAIRLRGVAGKIFEEAAIAGSAARTDRPDRRAKSDGGGMHHRARFEAARICSEKFRREVIGTFDDHIHGANEITRVLGKESGTEELDPAASRDALERLLRGVEFVSTHVSLMEQDLAVQIRGVDGVVVSEHDAAHAGLSECQRGRAAEPAHSDDEDASASDSAKISF